MMPSSTSNPTCHQKFVLLQEEKKRLLLLQQPRQQQLQQFRQQMNDFNKRQHAVVQQMSAVDRYKRNKVRQTTTATQRVASRSCQARPSPTTTDAALVTAQLASTNRPPKSVGQLNRMIFETILPPMILWWFLRIMIRLIAVDIKQQAVDIKQQALKEDLLEDKKMYSELAAMLRAETIAEDEEDEKQQQQSDTKELSESEKFRQSMRGQVMGVIRSRRERQKEMERSRKEDQERRRKQQAEAQERDRLNQERRRIQQAEAEERDRLKQERRRQEQAEAEERARIHQARLEEIRAQSAEQTRIRLAQLKEQQDREDAAYRKSTQEFRDDFVAEKACIVRRIEKRRANKAWHLEWSNQLPLIIRRRANQSANAG